VPVNSIKYIFLFCKYASLVLWGKHKRCISGFRTAWDQISAVTRLPNSHCGTQEVYTPGIEDRDGQSERDAEIGALFSLRTDQIVLTLSRHQIRIALGRDSRVAIIFARKRNSSGSPLRSKHTGKVSCDKASECRVRASILHRKHAWCVG